MEQEACRSQGDLPPRGCCDWRPALSAESLYDHVLAWGQWDDVAGERFERAARGCGLVFCAILSGCVVLVGVLVWGGAFATGARWPGAPPQASKDNNAGQKKPPHHSSQQKSREKDAHAERMHARTVRQQ